MVFADLVWVALGISGGLLLIGDISKLNGKQKVGVILVFVAFLVQVYWEILHQAAAPALTWNLNSQVEVGYVTVLLVILVAFVYRRRSRKVMSGGGSEVKNIEKK
jgi:threonine/homoserine efflux transporter RhtA